MAPMHLVLSLIQPTQRLAALVPRPRLHLIRFHGVLAPTPAARSCCARSAGAEHGEQDSEQRQRRAKRARAHWLARLLKRVFDIDMTHCPNRSRES
ncbi:MAG: transposase [Burkholderiaceae bacterium]